MPSRAVDEARRILHDAEARGVVLRLLGGVAILVRCPSANGGALARQGAPDIDLAGLKGETTGIKGVLEGEGYTPNQNFNAIHGHRRLMFYGPGGEPKVDVFLDKFAMCHSLDLRGRLTLEALTLPLADLLFTKLQIVELNEKDLKDIAALLLDHEVAAAEGEGDIDGAYLARLSARRWGTYTTLTDTLARVEEALPRLGLPPRDVETIRGRIGKLRGLLEAAPKGPRWRLRALVGRRMLWYEMPDEPRAIKLGGYE